jgi:hypothetical protein
MTLAHDLGLPERKGYVPAAFAATAFALGVQIALVTEALGPAGYPPAGKASLAWGSALGLGISAVLHVPWRRIVDDAREALGSDIPRRSVHLAPYHEPSPQPSTPEGVHNGHAPPEPENEVGARLQVRVHSPLSAGPAIAPGEDLPLVVEAEPEDLARELEVTIDVHGPSGSGTVHKRMPGTQLEHTVTFAEEGAFNVTIELSHPRAQPTSTTLRGRVAPYEAVVGDLFERVKDQATRAGLDVGPDSTPRELCRELRTLSDVDASQLADLAVELEVAMYGDEAVDRATYETVYEAIAATGLLEEGPAREVAR